MLSAIRKFFNRSGGHHQKLEGQLEEQEQEQQKAPSEKKLQRKLQRELKRQRRQDKRRQSAASEAGAPLKGPPACGIVGSSLSGGSNTSSDGSGGSSSGSNESDNSSASSSSSNTSDSNGSNVDGGGERSCCHEGETFANAVAMDGDNMAARHQQHGEVETQQQDADNRNDRTEGDYINGRRHSQQGACDPDDNNDNDEGEDEDLDEVDDFDDDDEDETVAFIAEAPNKQQHYQHLHQHQQHQQQHHQPQQQSDRLTASCQVAAASSATTTTTPAAAVQQPRKTEVDQLLTGSTASAAQKRDSVRGNLEELRVAESVNYRPVVYKYSFRVADVPANMRVFTDPDDRRIEAIARSCESQIHLEKLPIRGPGSLRMRKVTIQSPDLHSLEKCCRQFDDRFPRFYVSGGLGLSSKSIQRVYVDELAEQQQLQQQY